MLEKSIKFVVMKILLTTILLLSASLSEANNNKYLFSGLKYPEIAQAIYRLETGNGKSLLYKKHNNLFGFRKNKRKIYTGLTKTLYCIYPDKYSSVLDYSYFERNLIKKYKIKSKAHFIKCLAINYAGKNNIKYSLKIKKLCS